MRWRMLGSNEEALARYRAGDGVAAATSRGGVCRGLCAGAHGKQKEAERRYRRALVLRPDFAAAWVNLGSLLREQGREAYAEAALLRAVELRPDLIPAGSIWPSGARTARPGRPRGICARPLR